jgi:hypothetical protein
MPHDVALTHGTLKTPRAAAFAGIIFSLLIIAFFGLLRVSIPADPLESGAWLASSGQTVALALNIVPFAGIAFLWFIGVLRDRLGAREDRFFATVFLGSALLFLAMLFAAAAVIGAIVLVAVTTRPEELISSTTFRFGRAAVYILMNVYAIKMAGVFMITTSTVALRTGIVPRWIAYLGFLLALILLLGSYYIGWSFMVLPIWVLLLSGHILVDNFRQLPAKPSGGAGHG